MRLVQIMVAAAVVRVAEQRKTVVQVDHAGAVAFSVGQRLAGLWAAKNKPVCPAALGDPGSTGSLAKLKDRYWQKLSVLHRTVEALESHSSKWSPAFFATPAHVASAVSALLKAVRRLGTFTSCVAMARDHMWVYDMMVNPEPADAEAAAAGTSVQMEAVKVRELALALYTHASKPGVDLAVQTVHDELEDAIPCRFNPGYEPEPPLYERRSGSSLAGGRWARLFGPRCLAFGFAVAHYDTASAAPKATRFNTAQEADVAFHAAIERVRASASTQHRPPLPGLADAVYRTGPDRTLVVPRPEPGAPDLSRDFQQAVDDLGEVPFDAFLAAVADADRLPEAKEARKKQGAPAPHEVLAGFGARLKALLADAAQGGLFHAFARGLADLGTDANEPAGPFGQALFGGLVLSDVLLDLVVLLPQETAGERELRVASAHTAAVQRVDRCFDLKLQPLQLPRQDQAWRDADGFGCDAYSDYCVTVAEGVEVYPGFIRSKANRETGTSALDACCACGGGAAKRCADAEVNQRPWKDADGLGCDDARYSGREVAPPPASWLGWSAPVVAEQLCRSRPHADSWEAHRIFQYANDEGVSALDACCECGGGVVDEKTVLEAFLHEEQGPHDQMKWEVTVHKAQSMALLGAFLMTDSSTGACHIDSLDPGHRSTLNSFAHHHPGQLADGDLVLALDGSALDVCARLEDVGEREGPFAFKMTLARDWALRGHGAMAHDESFLRTGLNVQKTAPKLIEGQGMQWVLGHLRQAYEQCRHAAGADFRFVTWRIVVDTLSQTLRDGYTGFPEEDGSGEWGEEFSPAFALSFLLSGVEGGEDSRDPSFGPLQVAAALRPALVKAAKGPCTMDDIIEALALAKQEDELGRAKNALVVSSVRTERARVHGACTDGDAAWSDQWLQTCAFYDEQCEALGLQSDPALLAQYAALAGGEALEEDARAEFEDLRLIESYAHAGQSALDVCCLCGGGLVHADAEAATKDDKDLWRRCGKGKRDDVKLMLKNLGDQAALATAQRKVLRKVDPETGLSAIHFAARDAGCVQAYREDSEKNEDRKIPRCVREKPQVLHVLVALARKVDLSGAPYLDLADRSGRTALIHAAYEGSEMVEVLLALGPSVLHRDQDGRTALHYVCARLGEFPDRAALLAEKLLTMPDIEPAALLQLEDKQGRTALHYAAGAVLDEKRGDRPHHEEQRAALLRTLLSLAPAGLELAQDEYGKTALLTALTEGYLQLFTQLLPLPMGDMPARDLTAVNTPCRDGISVVSYLCALGHEELAKRVIGLGADLTVADTRSRLPTHFAAGAPFVSGENWYWKYGIQPPPGSVVLLQELLEPSKGMDVHAVDKRDKTKPNRAIVHYAAAEGHPDVLEAALKAGADVFHETYDVEQAFDVATTPSRPDIRVMRLLLTGAQESEGARTLPDQAQYCAQMLRECDRLGAAPAPRRKKIKNEVTKPIVPDEVLRRITAGEEVEVKVTQEKAHLRSAERHCDFNGFLELPDSAGKAGTVTAVTARDDEGWDVEVRLGTGDEVDYVAFPVGVDGLGFDPEPEEPLLFETREVAGSWCAENQALLQTGRCMVNHRNGVGRMPLHTITRFATLDFSLDDQGRDGEDRAMELYDLLLLHGADINGEVGAAGGETALHIFVKSLFPLLPPTSPKPLKLVEFLLSRGACPDRHAGNKKETPLHNLALMLPPSERKVALAQLFLEAGADPNAVDYLGRTALHLAVLKSDKALLELLLAAGADPSKPDSGVTDNNGEPMARPASTPGDYCDRERQQQLLPPGIFWPWPSDALCAEFRKLLGGPAARTVERKTICEEILAAAERSERSEERSDPPNRRPGHHEPSAPAKKPRPKGRKRTLPSLPPEGRKSPPTVRAKPLAAVKTDPMKAIRVPSDGKRRRMLPTPPSTAPPSVSRPVGRFRPRGRHRNLPKVREAWKDTAEGQERSDAVRIARKAVADQLQAELASRLDKEAKRKARARQHERDLTLPGAVDPLGDGVASSLSAKVEASTIRPVRPPPTAETSRGAYDPSFGPAKRSEPTRAWASQSAVGPPRRLPRAPTTSATGSKAVQAIRSNRYSKPPSGPGDLRTEIIDDREVTVL